VQWWKFVTWNYGYSDNPNIKILYKKWVFEVQIVYIFIIGYRCIDAG